ncbi:TRAP-type mannitol/chloroaromatic compound transport system, small permease component [Pseudorhodobacter antarcticus]|uniref:TRAP transporter small permease protein n=1 Tax=Pseudorhodobacter antarcticus TaxID=1077947 RepID=A0A1H8L0T5_9RHOB|nr:TRAP transporter small permease [Pseudorhodobacter antarcticus]SEN98763.1 TRAP-type mannitol/chloroaromatic compound transport system, small permease component [Pseudorhodobacter antarcticus]
MRRFLDRLYMLSGGLAALAILGICLLIAAQITFNVIARIGGAGLSYTIPSYADFAGYMLSTATFMALAYTLRAGGHIRVGLVVQRLPRRVRWGAEVGSLAVGALFATTATYYAGLLMAESWHYGDKSTGIVAIPTWMPQVFMVAGLALLAVAFVDTMIESLRAGGPILTDMGAE